MTIRRKSPISPARPWVENAAPLRFRSESMGIGDPPSVQEKTEQRIHRGVIPLLAGAAMLGMINQMSLDPFMPVISNDLNVSVPVLGQVTTLAFIGAAAVSLFAGPISDMYGKRRVLIVGVIAIALSAFGTLLAPSFAWLLGSRVLTAVSAGTVAGTTLASAGALYDGEDRRRAMSWIASGLAAGAIVGIPFLTLMASLSSWRGAHGAVTGFALLWVVLMNRYLPEDIIAGGRFDVRGLVAAYRPLLRQPEILALFGSTTARAIAWVGLLTYVGAYLGNEFSLSSTEIGWAYMVGGGGYFAGTKLAAGRLGGFDPLRSTALATAVMGLLVGAALTFAGEPLTVIALITGASLAGGFGWVMLMSVVSTTTTAGQGTTMSLNAAMFQFGSALGALFGGVLLAGGGYATLGTGLMASALLAAILVLVPVLLPRIAHVRIQQSRSPAGSPGDD